MSRLSAKARLKRIREVLATLPTLDNPEQMVAALSDIGELVEGKRTATSLQELLEEEEILAEGGE